LENTYFLIVRFLWWLLEIFGKQQPVETLRFILLLNL